MSFAVRKQLIHACTVHSTHGEQTSNRIIVVKDDKVIGVDGLPFLKTTESFWVHTLKGERIEADLVIPCYGQTANTKMLQSSLGECIRFLSYFSIFSHNTHCCFNFMQINSDHICFSCP